MLLEHLVRGFGWRSSRVVQKHMHRVRMSGEAAHEISQGNGWTLTFETKPG